MWSDKRTNADLVANYESGGPKYNEWYDAISAAGTGLPGADQAANKPTVDIDANNTVTITIYWQAPGESAPHKYVTVATVTN
jgi:type IV pilus assembly protein PilV